MICFTLYMGGDFDEKWQILLTSLCFTVTAMTALAAEAPAAGSTEKRQPSS